MKKLWQRFFVRLLVLWLIAALFSFAVFKGEATGADFYKGLAFMLTPIVMLMLGYVSDALTRIEQYRYVVNA
jgi:hypothetical protein